MSRVRKESEKYADNGSDSGSNHGGGGGGGTYRDQVNRGSYRDRDPPTHYRQQQQHQSRGDYGYMRSI